MYLHTHVGIRFQAQSYMYRPPVPCERASSLLYSCSQLKLCVESISTNRLFLICGLSMMAAPYRAHRLPRRRTFFAQEAYRGPPAGLPGRPVSKTTVASQNRVGQLHPNTARVSFLYRMV